MEADLSLSSAESPLLYSSSVSDTSNVLKKIHNQDIDDIRRRSEDVPFKDAYFKTSINVLLPENLDGEYAKIVFQAFKCSNKFQLQELESKIKWHRCQVYDVFLIPNTLKRLNTNFCCCPEGYIL